MRNKLQSLQFQAVSCNDHSFERKIMSWDFVTPKTHPKTYLCWSCLKGKAPAPSCPADTSEQQQTRENHQTFSEVSRALDLVRHSRFPWTSAAGIFRPIRLVISTTTSLHKKQWVDKFWNSPCGAGMWYWVSPRQTKSAPHIFTFLSTCKRWAWSYFFNFSNGTFSNSIRCL